MKAPVVQCLGVVYAYIQHMCNKMGTIYIYIYRTAETD